MKKSHGKPLICLENFESGEVITNSKEYEMKIREKREKTLKKDFVSEKKEIKTAT